MSRVSVRDEVRAKENAAENGSRSECDGAAIENGSDDTDWFTIPARQLLSPDAGLALHYLVDAPESSCYRWMRGEAQIPIYRYRKLLHGPAGETWLRVLMEGCAQPWWREWQGARELTSKFKIEPRS